MIYQVYQHSKKVMKYKKTIRRKVICYKVPKQFKTPEFQNVMLSFFYTNSIHPCAPS